MDLFKRNERENLLPYDGIVEYLGPFLKPKEASDYFDAIFSSSAWKHDEAKIFAKHIITKRKVAWYGDDDFEYIYSGTAKKALPWTDVLYSMKTLVEEKSRAKFNSCLLNLYHSGNEGMAWHSDDEKSLGERTTIASVSLGTERKFYFRHKKTKETIAIDLEPGSLLLMRGETQTNWLHALPKMKRIQTPRINLTYRQFKLN
ncbi:oxidoreductase, 2OG-Fe(II) oxygenase family protein [Leptospira ryugenii]|uniref:Oxidoreductase, 2OG-Fe(II) oxygenase family protein n=1 Tax=Leptospira ryugenii TaxID=1917863 RepID=A0A2P2E423_9LEPT|nr:alpha-ketoglutarate-dependent dioxygenase AlkB [Leptospira ryugenii]GBF51594.1 oxidoreductase, 2OG-Fe(II) oxygenase family protein [Leptospira ryugenii]